MKTIIDIKVDNNDIVKAIKFSEQIQDNFNLSFNTNILQKNPNFDDSRLLDFSYLEEPYFELPHEEYEINIFYTGSNEPDVTNTFYKLI